MINYFKSAERTLSERANLEKALANLERRKDRILRRGAPSDNVLTDYARPYVSGGGANTVLSEMIDLAEIKREIEFTREMIEEIDDVLGQLEQTDADLLRAWYIERESKEKIAERINYSSSSTIYDLRNKAVAAFAVLYFGAGALAST